MKKIFTLLVAVSSFTVSFAQQSWSNEHKRSPENSHYNYDYTYKQKDHGYSDGWYNEGRYNDRGYNNRQHQREIDQVNQECDREIYSYRNDRSLSRYERNRRIRQVESERSVRINSFGTGAIVGAAAGLILGAILSH